VVGIDARSAQGQALVTARRVPDGSGMISVNHARYSFWQVGGDLVKRAIDIERVIDHLRIHVSWQFMR
jgi:hypothetical protein